jgi:hypothetical protein
MEQTKQLFFSHTWQADGLSRNTHARVYQLAKLMERCGWSIWIDEDNMKGNIDAAMASGIDGADAVIVCLTQNYCKKVNETARNPRKRDNCLKEWTYANIRNKLLIPVIMEPELLSLSNWPAGIVPLQLGSTLYVNASMDCLHQPTFELIKQLGQHHLQPNKPMCSSTYLGLEQQQQRLRSKSLDSQTKIQFANFHNIAQRYLFLQKRFMSTQHTSQSRSFDTRPRNLLGRSLWKSTGQLAVSI